MSDLTRQKSELRNGALARRKGLEPDFRAAAAEAIATWRFPIAVPQGAVLAGYMPIRSEIDPRPLMQALAARGAALALPAIAADRQPLIFRAWRAGDPMRRGQLGIQEPMPDAQIVVPDIVLVPLAAFDRRGHRIGYGAGYYDRALGALRAKKQIMAVGVAFAAQEAAQVPNEAHDVPLDFVLTEAEAIAIRSS